jgi:hypothetical protein
MLSNVFFVAVLHFLKSMALCTLEKTRWRVLWQEEIKEAQNVGDTLTRGVGERAQVSVRQSLCR